MKKSGGSFQFPFGQRRSRDRVRPEGRSAQGARSEGSADKAKTQAKTQQAHRRDRRRAVKAELSKLQVASAPAHAVSSNSSKTNAGQPTSLNSLRPPQPIKANAPKPQPPRMGQSNAQKPNAQKPNAQKPNAQRPNAQKPNAQRPNNVAQFPKGSAPATHSSLEALRAKRSQRTQRQNSGIFAPPQNPIQIPQPRTRPGTAFLYGARLMILGIGLGVIGGTMLSIWDPTKFTAGANSTQESTQVQIEDKAALKLGQENVPLKAQIQALVTQNSGLTPAVFLADLDTQSYVDINGTEALPAASTIKFPILVAFFQDVDAGKVQLNTPLTMRKELIVGEAGDMQTQPVGTKFSALKTATEMMTKSDNTATNMMIDLLGGAEALNQRFQAWGLSQTVIRDWLPDVKGTNTTSAKDLAMVMAQVNEGKVVSLRSRDRILEIMRRNEFNNMLPKGLGEGATIAHKTGTIGILLGDVGLVDTATGKRYLAAVLVQRPRDDERAEPFIQQVSKAAYQTFNQQTDAAAPSQPPAGRSRRTNIAQP